MTNSKKKALRKIVLNAIPLFLIIGGLGGYFYVSVILPKKNERFYTNPENKEKINEILTKEKKQSQENLDGFYISSKRKLNNVYKFNGDTISNYLDGQLTSVKVNANRYFKVGDNYITSDFKLEELLVNSEDSLYSKYSYSGIKEINEMITFIYESEGNDTLIRVKGSKLDSLLLTIK